MKYSPKWDLSSIPYDLLQKAAAEARAKRGPGRPPMPRCQKCGLVLRLRGDHACRK
jgi:hypothetical protein